MNSSIDLAYEFTYRTAVVGPHEVGQGPFGVRQHYELADGVVEGPRLSARSVDSGADWMLSGADGFMRMDARVQLLTGDGAVLLARYHGPAESNARLQAAIAGGEPTDFEEQRIRTWWELESGDPRYAWVNQTVFVGEARFQPTESGQPGFEHRVYRAA